MNTDKENFIASKLAYFDLDYRFQYFRRARNTPVPLRDVLTQDQLNELLEARRDIGTEFLDWKLAISFDDNDGSGTVGYVFETGDGHATVAFRGSEDGNLMEIVDDWARSDAGLILGETTGHNAVRTFMSQHAKELRRYESLSVTGHSLGGNLAEFMTIVSDEYGLDQKITQCTSLDGPGFTEEFLEQHAAQIQKMNGKMKHYYWSIVGGLLTAVPGVERQMIKLKDPSLKQTLFKKHALNSVYFDNNGAFAEDPEGYNPVEMSIVNLSQGKLDAVSFPVLTLLAYKGVPALLGTPVGGAVVTVVLFAGICVLAAYGGYKLGVYLKKKQEERLRAQAHSQAIQDRNIYLDPVAFISCSSEAASIAADIVRLETKLATFHGASVPKIQAPFSIPNAVYDALKSIWIAIDTTMDAIRKLKYSFGMFATRMGRCVNTMIDVENYLLQTANSFREVEERTKRRTSEWRDSWNG